MIREDNTEYNNMNNTIRKTVELIEKNNLDELIVQHLQPCTEDDILNQNLQIFEDSFMDIIERLEYLGYITITGYKIKRNNLK